MNQQTEQLLRELAVRFETTTEHLWEVMIQQASITATMNAITAFFLTGATIITWCFVKAKTTPKPNSLIPSLPHEAEWDEEAAVVWPLLIIATIVVTGVVISLILTSVTASLNPEYWALQQILELKR